MKAVILIFFALPLCYLSVSYIYLALWHRKWWLFPVITHEDGRHTLWGSIVYWPHFLACMPTALFISLCIAGGALAATHVNIFTGERPFISGMILITLSIAFVVLAFLRSLRHVGLEQTLHYTLQKFERDNVSSWGGCWNQFVPSNIVIGIGAIAAGIVAGGSIKFPGADFKTFQDTVSLGNMWVLGVAVLWFVVLCIVFKTGRRSFTETRWLAHSVREIGTYPLTMVPAGLGAIIYASYKIYPDSVWNTTIPLCAIGLFIVALAMFIWQLITLHGKDVLAISQKPPFAPNGLKVPYLMAAHVFEHFTDIIFITITATGFYLLGLGVQL